MRRTHGSIPRKPYYRCGGVALYRGDCVDVMRTMPPCSVDSIITDPPYGLEFMGVAWDTMNKGGPRTRNTWGDFGSREHARQPFQRARVLRNKAIAFYDFSLAWARAALRVAKPGAFLLALGGTRTYHRLACAIEDAGWEIRDCMMWLYGSGFPKSRDISRAINKAAGGERKVVAKERANVEMRGGNSSRKSRSDYVSITAPATESANLWKGWGTALKPAWEPIIVGMKPLEGTFEQNAMKHGVAGLNVEGGRIRYINNDRLLRGGTYGGNRCSAAGLSMFGNGGKSIEYGPIPKHSRWPANLVLTHHPDCRFAETRPIKGNASRRTSRRPCAGESATGPLYGVSLPGNQHTDPDGEETLEARECHPDCPARTLDKQSGGRRAGGSLTGGEPSRPFVNCYGTMNGRCVWASYDDTGGASRFFYCAKASRAERNAGLPAGMRNGHPTVKPLKLMEYLCRLTATPTGGVVLDPFAGSGTTLLAARNAGRKGIGIEVDPAYVKLAQHRLASCRAKECAQCEGSGK